MENEEKMIVDFITALPLHGMWKNHG